MRIVVADTSPLHYLVLIGAVDLLPRLFAQVLIPITVRDEMQAAGAPLAVRQWMETPPAWLTVHDDPPADGDALLQLLDKGERSAISLAMLLHPDLVLMDDRAGVAAARAKGIVVTGTLGILDIAAGRGLIDIAKAIEALRATNFHMRQSLIDALLSRQT